MMNKLSRAEIVILLTPLLTSLLFVMIVPISHWLFQNQIISARQAIGHELIIFGIGLLAIIIMCPLAIKWIIKKRWRLFLFGTVSTALFWIGVAYGRLQGAAMFYAT